MAFHASMSKGFPLEQSIDITGTPYATILQLQTASYNNLIVYSLMLSCQPNRLKQVTEIRQEYIRPDRKQDRMYSP